METGWFPSQREIGRRLGIHSSATIAGYVHRLKEANLVNWHHTAGIRLTRAGIRELLIWRMDPDSTIELELALDEHITEMVTKIMAGMEAELNAF